MKGKTYVLSDIHGNFEIFKRMLEKIQFNSHDQLYILGDICDRGPCSLDIYFYIQKFDNITLLKGNHEYMMQEALKEAISKRIKEKSDNLYNYLKNLPLYIELTVNHKDYVLVHAGIDPENSLEDQEEDTLLWIRDYFFLSECDLKKTYIFGHTPLCFINRDKSFDVWYDDEFHNKIGIDGGLALGERGQLNCICLDDDKVFVIKMSEVNHA